MTLAHEKDRTGRKPKWVAIDNNEDGYDVFSVVDAEDSRALSIEVKISTMGLAGSFHLTRNEWDGRKKLKTMPSISGLCAHSINFH